jgi:hypothetical protein
MSLLQFKKLCFNMKRGKQKGMKGKHATPTKYHYAVSTIEKHINGSI